MGSIAKLLGGLLKIIYDVVNNYGVAIIIFTVFIRLILLPLNIKQQKSMMRMQAVTPLISEIQEKYKNDKEKQSQETMKIYQKYKISPFAGCLPLLIQFPVLIALIWVIYDPGRYLFGVDTANAVAQMGIENPTVAKLVMAVKECGLKSMFLGIDLTSIPNFAMVSTLWIFPILATVATYFSGKITQAKQTQNTSSNEENPAQQSSKMMTTMMPLMTLFFTFTMPVAASFYWFISSAIQVLQTIVLNKVLKVETIELDNGGNWHERNNKKRKNG